MMRRASSHLAHLVMEAVLGGLALLAVAGCALAWRLAQGPIDITPLAHRAERRMDTAGWRVAVDHASLAWEGFAHGDSPIDIRWEGARMTRADGARLATLPRGRVTLALARLLTGRVVPRTLEVEDARFAIDRHRDGSLGIQLENPATPQPAATGQGPGDGATLLRGLAEGDRSTLLGQLRRVRITGAAVDLRDGGLGVVWRAQHATILLLRQPHGLRAEATLDLTIGASGTAGATALSAATTEATLTAAADISRDGLDIVASSSPLVPHALALASPAFAALSPIDAPLSLAAALSLTLDLRPRQGTLALQLGPGRLFAPRGQTPIQDGEATLSLRGGVAAELETLRLALRRTPDTVGPTPTLTATASLSRTAGPVTARFAAELDRAAFADLALWWPNGVGGGARPWVTENITAGMAEHGHVTGTLAADPDGANLRLTSIAGGIAARGMTLHWLRPVPPIEDADATLTLDGPDALTIAIPSGRQGAMRLSAGHMRITGLAAPDQVADIAATIDSSLPDTLALLNHPRLRLLSRRKLDLGTPAGHAQAHLTVHLPLEDAVTMDDIGIKAAAHLTEVHLGGVAAGHDLDGGKLDLTVNPDALTLTGTAEVAGMPASLGVDMDFRAGPPSQVLEHYTARATARPDSAARLGLPAGILTGGEAALTVDYATRRDATGRVALAADLAQAAITLPVGWRKQPGPKASLSAQLRLAAGHLTGIDHVTADGPGLAIRAHADVAAGQPATLRIDQARLGASDAAGSITLPGPNRRLRVALRGRVLDLSDYLTDRAKTSERQAANPPPDDDTPGPPWSADIAFTRLILARDEILDRASATIDTDGLRWTRARIAAGDKGELLATITPDPTGRTLSVTAADSGAVLLAAGVADNIRGGRLRLDGRFDDRAPHSPLTGTATLEEFRITDAPAIGRVLKAMTLYGAVDLLRGPGLGWQKAVAPFRWQQRALTLANARAFSASLGVTAKGTIDLRRHRADIEGTVVPAYFFNQLLGRIPVLGQVFSPEKGGGVFAARYSVKGALGDPKIGVNPLSALTPGVLRKVFDIF